MVGQGSSNIFSAVFKSISICVLRVGLSRGSGSIFNVAVSQGSDSVFIVVVSQKVFVYLE